MGDPGPTVHRNLAEQSGPIADALAALADLLSFAVGDRAPAVADRLIAQHGSIGAVLSMVPDGLETLFSDEPDAVRILRAARRSMLTSLKADFVMAPLSHARAVVDYIRHSMTFARSETVRVLYLDRQHRLLLDEVVSRGSFSASTLPIRDILKKAMILEASGFLIAHNHPSGDPSPTPQDRIATAKLQRACAALDLAFHDHLIVASAGWTSFRALGLLDEAITQEGIAGADDRLCASSDPRSGKG